MRNNIKNVIIIIATIVLKGDFMNKPYIICHMVTSIDGKVTGDFLSSPASVRACEIYYEINRNLKSNGFICGRVTMESSFTGGYYPDLIKYKSKEKHDFIPDNLSGFYAVAFDTNGKLGWKSNKIIDPDGDLGYDGAQIIEVLSENVDERYLGYLEEMEIPYIFAGKDKIEVELALFKLKNIVGIDTLLLEGGSIINGAFQRANVIDELSLVVAPIVAEKDGKPLFMDATVRDFELTYVKDGVLVMNYKNNYDSEVKQRWGDTEAYKEHAEKTANYTEDKWQEANDGLNAVLAKFAECKKNGYTPDSDEAQALVIELQSYVTDNYYTCTNEILSGLGQMYVADERFKTNIDKNGDGTAEFISEAIKVYCSK